MPTLHKFDVVLVWKMERFGALEKAGMIRFMVPQQGIDSDMKSPAGRLFMLARATVKHIAGARR